MFSLKKILIAGLLFAAAMFALPVTAAAEYRCSAASAIVMEPETGTVLYEKDADARMLVASTTKIMTAMVVLEHCRLSETVEVTPAHAAVEGSSMYLRPGGAYTVEDLLYGLLLASGNDAAAALADHCAGSADAFARLMNEKCAALGLPNTHFVNPHGLDAPEHYSSARDLARITAAAMENPTFRKIFSTVSYTVNGITYVNHNKLLTGCEGCVGGKTGYTEAAGRILVSCVEREGMRLICVTISDPDDWLDHAALYDAAFSDWRFVSLPESSWQEMETVSGMRSRVRLVCDTAGFVVPKDSDIRLHVRLPRFVFAPVLAGAQAGEADIWIDGAPSGTAAIYYGETVPADGAAAAGWERFRRLFSKPGAAGIYYLTQ